MHKYGLELLLWTGDYTENEVYLIEHAKKLGFDGVEIHLGKPQNIPIEKTKQALKEHGMEAQFVVTLNEQTNAIASDTEIRKNSSAYFKRCIDVASAISGSGCTIGGVNYAAWGYFTGTARTEQEWDWAIQNYKNAATYARDKGITLAVEPINRFETFFLNTAEDAVKFCKDVSEKNVKVHLDTYHMIREEKSFYNAIVETGKYLGYFHACENERGVPGTGLVQWEEVYRGLKDVGYQGWITIESFVPDIEELARMTAIWRKLAPSADYLAGEGLKNIKLVEQKVFS
jgi:D-psicose/D-tagatose/L-ribulose 3-epimerase